LDVKPMRFSRGDAEVQRRRELQDHERLITEGGWAVGLRIEEDESKLSWAEAAQGAYLLRTNCREQDPCKLWHWYVHLTEVEDAFRIGKSDLELRPEKNPKCSGDSDP
jgi:hypothetical protein